MCTEQKNQNFCPQEFVFKKLLQKSNIYKSIENLIDDKKYRLVQNGKIKKDYTPIKQIKDMKQSKQLKESTQYVKPFLLLSSGIIEQSLQKQVIIKDGKNLIKNDINKIKIQFAKQIQREKGRLRMSNLQYFNKLKKKQQKQIILQAKTILPSIKEKLSKAQIKFDKQPQENNNQKSTNNGIITLRQMMKSNPRDHCSAIISNNPPNSEQKKLPQLDKKQSLLDITEKRILKIQSKKQKNKNFEKSQETINQISDNQQVINNGLESQDTKQLTAETQNQISSIKIILKNQLKRKESREYFLAKNNRDRDRDQRLERYKQFLFKINFANNIYVDLNLQQNSKKIIYYIGKGNNSLLIKSLLKRRFWWVEGTYQQANFIWTQLKKTEIYNRQQNHISQKLNMENFQSRKGSNCFADIQNPWKPPKGSKSQGNQKIFQSIQSLQYNNLNSPFKRLKKVFPQLTHNHFPGNCHLGNKKALFFNLRQYCRLANKQLFDIVPLTFHVGKQYKNFVKEYRRRQKLINEGQKISNIWIVKPGENSNRGNGIHVIESIKGLDQLLTKNKPHANGQQKTYIVQLYMHRPFLYNKRKFDIRHYMLITNSGSIRAYWYKQGYIRTSSNLFDLEDTQNNQIHLTNDAIQKYSQTYGKYEQGNKLSYSQFQRYLENHYKQKKYCFNDVLQKMKQIATEAVKSTFIKLDENNKEFNFQIFGLDFMLDQNLRPWLIQINTNPCLEISSNLLGRIIPGMVEHAFRLSLDSLYPPPCQYPPNQRHYLPDRAQQYLKFQIIFTSQYDGAKIRQLYKNSSNSLQFGDIQQEDQQYQDDGHQIDFKQ